MNQPINSAMVLCAGLGKRMRPVSQDIPKPMIEVMGKSLIERTIEFAYKGGIDNFVINLHYKADILRKHIEALNVSKKVNIQFIFEEVLLETGGGAKNALSYFGSSPFFTFNSDQIWIAKSKNLLNKMRNMWNDQQMNSLLLLIDKGNAVGYKGKGDFDLNPNNMITRDFNQADRLYPYVYTGLQLTSYKFFLDSPDGTFSFLELFKKSQVNETLQGIYGITYRGPWIEVGTPEGLKEAEKELKV
jgi:N-acetyl-alpha-D-muramate 1-phosphate uridylyltransferase